MKYFRKSILVATILSSLFIASNSQANDKLISLEYHSSSLADGHDISFKNGKITCIYKYYGERKGPIEVTPEAIDYSEFRKALDKINIWKWKEFGKDSALLIDGHIWNLSIKYPDASANFERASSQDDDLKALLGAIDKLMGENLSKKCSSHQS